MPLNKYADRDEEDVCRGCPLVGSKSEAMPADLAEHAAAALTFGELQQAGATFAYPASLTAAEWAALSGLQRGRSMAENLRAERDRREAKKKERRR